MVTLLQTTATVALHAGPLFYTSIILKISILVLEHCTPGNSFDFL